MKFAQVIGFESIKAQLIQTVKDGHVSHALMFLGKEGGGNLPLALAFAAYILCEKPGEHDRCGQCAACKQLDQLGHPDLHFSFPFVKTSSIKTAEPHRRDFVKRLLSDPYLTLPEWEQELSRENKKSLITADEALEVVKALTLKSFARGHKIMLIWSAEKLNTQAQNRLLKTLEEPTDRTLIILVCNSVDSVLPTIRSRVQMVFCPPLSQGDIARALTERDGMSWDEAEKLAAQAEGSYQAARIRRSLEEQYAMHLNLFSAWMRHTYKRSFAEIFKLGDTFVKLGKDGQQQFLDYAMEFVHKCILREFAAAGDAPFDPNAAAFASKFAPYITGGDMKKLHDVLSHGHYLVERNVNAHLLFTQMSIELIRYFAVRKTAQSA